MAEALAVRITFPQSLSVRVRFAPPPSALPPGTVIVGPSGASTAAKLSFDDTLTALGVDNVQDAIVALYALIGATPPAPAPVLLSGALSGSSALAGALSVTRALSGQVSGSGALTAALTVEREGLSGSVIAAGLLTGSLEVTKALVGAVEGSAAVVGALEVTRALSAALEASGMMTGSLTVERLLAGSVAGAGALSAGLTVERALAGSIYGMGALTGDLTVEEAPGPSVTYLPSSPAPQFVFSPYRMVAAYPASSPVAMACASNAPHPAATLVPIPTRLDGTPNTDAAVSAFGPTFDVAEIVDQTGNYPNALPTNAGNRFKWDVTAPNGKQSWMTNFGGRYNVPTGTFTRRSVSLFEVLGGTMQGSNANSTFGFGDGFNNGMSTLSEATGRGVLGSAFARGAGYHGYGPTVVGFTSSASALRVRTGDQRSGNLGVQTDLTMTGFSLGAGYYAADSKFYHGWIGYNVALSDAEELAVKNALDTIFNIVPWTTMLYARGDSIQYGQGPAFPLLQNRFAELRKTLPPTVFMVNGGIPGSSSSDLNAAHFTARRIAGTTQIYMENWGSNDFASNKTAAAMFGANDTTTNTTRSRLANAKAAGFLALAQTTIRRPTYNAGQETERAAYRQAMLDNAAALGFTVSDYGNDVYPLTDNIHPSSYAALAAIDAAALTPLLT